MTRTERDALPDKPHPLSQARALALSLLIDALIMLLAFLAVTVPFASEAADTGPVGPSPMIAVPPAPSFLLRATTDFVIHSRKDLP
jgi:uncharacterized RDD family membrane protein YckC